LPDDPCFHAAAFAYLSDWWLNFSALGLHLRDLNGRQLYISSLNHALWLHRPVRADQWLHVDCTSPCAQAGRGLSIGAVHDAQGRQLASMTQECLMAYTG
jgi:acyl-CoA thioesterase II